MKSEKIFSGERKVLAAGIVVVLLANAAGLTLYILEKRSGDRENTEYLERREFGQGDYEEKLTVKSEKGNQDITVQVREKEYGEEEAEEIIEQVKEEMDALIRGENKSLNKVPVSYTHLASIRRQRRLLLLTASGSWQPSMRPRRRFPRPGRPVLTEQRRR